MLTELQIQSGIEHRLCTVCKYRVPYYSGTGGPSDFDKCGKFMSPATGLPKYYTELCRSNFTGQCGTKGRWWILDARYEKYVKELPVPVPKKRNRIVQFFQNTVGRLLK